MIRDYYQVLGINSEATSEEIKRAYRKLVLEHHPDRNWGKGDSEDLIREINEAYHTLGQEETRRQYDFQQGQVRGTRPFFDGFSEDAAAHMERFATGVYQSPKRGRCHGKGSGGRGCGRRPRGDRPQTGTPRNTWQSQDPKTSRK